MRLPYESFKLLEIQRLFFNSSKTSTRRNLKFPGALVFFSCNFHQTEKIMFSLDVAWRQLLSKGHFFYYSALLIELPV